MARPLVTLRIANTCGTLLGLDSEGSDSSHDEHQVSCPSVLGLVLCWLQDISGDEGVVGAFLPTAGRHGRADHCPEELGGHA